MSPIIRVFASSDSLIFVLTVLLVCTYIQGVMAQESESDDKISTYKSILEQNPDDANAHKALGTIYAKSGMIDEAIKQFQQAMEIEYRKGYETGERSALREKKLRVYASTLILSIITGLFVAAAILTILSWSEINDRLRDMRRNSRIRR